MAHYKEIRFGARSIIGDGGLLVLPISLGKISNMPVTGTYISVRPQGAPETVLEEVGALRLVQSPGRSRTLGRWTDAFVSTVKMGN